MRTFAIFLVILGIALSATVSAVEYDRDDALALSQAAIGKTVGDHVLRDIDGQSFNLAQLRGKPLVVSMIYTSCHHVCPTITQSVASAVDIGREALGEESF